MSSADVHDVVVVGGGPAGSVMAWSLARRGVRVAVVERASFPREKVCGDFVEPGGLRILEAMQCRQALDDPSRLPITSTRVFVQSRVAYRGEIPYYQEKHGLPPYGYIVPRHELDTHLLDRACAESATVYEGCAATEIHREGGFIRVGVRSGHRHFTLSSRLVVGADGTESTVAKSFGLARGDRRYIAISQRAYVEGVSVEGGEATIWFDDDLFPGYGWMFPMSGGRANVGVGILSESCHRYGLSVPKLFNAFIEKLRVRHSGCAEIRVVGKPLGGVVKTYGGISRNHFDGGVLIGDAGSFVDPMTGEGITPGMESALIASSTVAESLARGKFDAAFLSQFERDFRRYFDPAMRYLDFCAALMRNWHFREYWLRAGTHGFAEAAADPVFARVAGSTFGGLELRPLPILGQLWSRIVSYVGERSVQMLLDAMSGTHGRPDGLAGDFGAWQRGWWRSLADDPLWHASWMGDVAKKWISLAQMRVAVVGAGIAGLTTALRLSQRGYEVTLFEEKEILGGNLSSQNFDGVYHDVYPHMFCDWYVNFWEIFESDLGLDRNAHFEPRTGVKLLRKGQRKYLELKNASNLQSIWGNLRSGVLPFPDMFIMGYSMLDLASQSFDRNELLSRFSVNGFLHSRPYATEHCAELHDFILMEIWSIHGDLTSAASYKDFVKHTFAFPRSTPFAWMMKGNLQETLIGPLQEKLQALGCTIRMGTKVKAVEFKNSKPEIELEGGERPQMDYVVLAVPAQVLANLVMYGKRGNRIVDRLPQLSELGRLSAERIAVVDLYFKRKLPGIPEEHVGLQYSDCDLTFLDISQLWTTDRNMRDRTVLVLAASDFYALPSEAPHEEGFMMIQQLHEYLKIFEPGSHWGDPKSDICWEKSRFLPNNTNKLYINEVGSWEWRPEASYDALPNVFFAGNFCRTDVDMATIEAAVQSGLQAAQALWKKERKGAPIIIAQSEVHTDTTFIAMKLALIPFAYWAKWWSIAFDAVHYLENGDLPRGLISPAARMMLLPFTYTVDWWETAYAFSKSVLYDGKSGEPASAMEPGTFSADPIALGAKVWSMASDFLEIVTSRELPTRDGSSLGDMQSGPYAFAAYLWRTVQSAYEASKMNGPGQAAKSESYRRRWRVKR